METRKIKYFLAVARWGSFTAAADRIGIAQPALSVQIAKLEARLGCALFIRHARGIELTPAGVRFHSHALEIWDKIEDARKDMPFVAGQSGPKLTIGLPTLTSTLLIAPLVEAAHKQLPRVTLRVREAMGSSLRNMLADGQLDLAVLYKVPGEGFTDAVPLFEESLYLGAVARLANWRGDTVPAGYLTKVPLVVSTAGNSHRTQLEYFAHQAGKRLNIVAEVDSISGQRELVLKGVGATVFPLSGFAQWHRGNLRLARIIGGGLLSQAYLVRSKKLRGSQALPAVENLVRHVVGELIDSGSWPGARQAFTH